MLTISHASVSAPSSEKQHRKKHRESIMGEQSILQYKRFCSWPVMFWAVRNNTGPLFRHKCEKYKLLF